MAPPAAVLVAMSTILPGQKNVEIRNPLDFRTPRSTEKLQTPICNLSEGTRILAGMKVLCLAWAMVIAALAPATQAQTPVVVELFTSEGCSSCPPADALLLQLDRMKAPNGSDIIVLGEHVDYWNSASWKDRFSSSEFTAQQQGYVSHFGLASAYTPQMVVDGSLQFVGNDKAKLTEAILQQSRNAKSATVSLTLQGDNQIHIIAKGPSAKKALVVMAITEGGLSSNVAGGENGGRTLQHAGVVRKMVSLGSLRDGEFERTRSLELESNWNRANLKVVVLVRQSPYGPIIGAASLPLGDSQPASSPRSTPATSAK